MKTIHTGDIVFIENPGINTSKEQTTLLKLELFQVLRKNKHAKTIEIISLKTGQKDISNKNLIQKIFVNDFISQDDAEECIRLILKKLLNQIILTFIERCMYVIQIRTCVFTKKERGTTTFLTVRRFDKMLHILILLKYTFISALFMYEREDIAKIVYVGPTLRLVPSKSSS